MTTQPQSRRQAQRAQLVADGLTITKLSHMKIADILLLTGLSRARYYRAYHAFANAHPQLFAKTYDEAHGTEHIDPLLL